MTRRFIAMLCVALISGISLNGFARGGPGGGFDNGSARGPTSESQAVSDSNGRFSADRDQGQARSQDRMSAQGGSHDKSTGKSQKRNKSGHSHKKDSPVR